jgi:hypothetical protein
VPIEIVIPRLRGIVEYLLGFFVLGRLLDDVLERHLGVRRALDQLVQLVDVGFMMLAVVERNGLGGNDRGECVLGIGELGKGETVLSFIQRHSAYSSGWLDMGSGGR